MKAFKWFIVLCFILGIGFISAAFVYGAGFDEVRDLFDDSDKYSEVKTYVFNESADKIVVDVEERHVDIIYSDVPFVTVEYREHENDTWTFDIDDDVVSIKQEKESRWRFINFGFTPQMYKEMIVYVPIGTTYYFSISTNVGKISLEFDTETIAQEVVVNSDTGSIHLKNLSVLDQIILSSDTGSIRIEDVVGSSLRVDLSTGSFHASDFTFDEVNIETSTGDVHVENGDITEDLVIDVSTGSIDIDFVKAGRYDLSSSTGNISLETDEQDVLYFDLKVSVGNITVFGSGQGTTHVTPSSTTHTVLVKARTSTGNIVIIAS